jgi:hypothetical protein
MPAGTVQEARHQILTPPICERRTASSTLPQDPGNDGNSAQAASALQP